MEKGMASKMASVDDGSDRTPWKCLILIANGGNLTTNGETVRKIINTSFLSISFRHKPFS